MDRNETECEAEDHRYSANSCMKQSQRRVGMETTLCPTSDWYVPRLRDLITTRIRQTSATDPKPEYRSKISDGHTTTRSKGKQYWRRRWSNRVFRMMSKKRCSAEWGGHRDSKDPRGEKECSRERLERDEYSPWGTMRLVIVTKVDHRIHDTIVVEESRAQNTA